MAYNPDNHAGGEGQFTIGGVDCFITSWTENLNKNSQDVTTTGDWNDTDKLTWGRKKTTKGTLDIDIEGFCDGNAPVEAMFRVNTDILGVVLKAFSGNTTTMDKAIVNTFARKNNGIEGIVSWSANLSCQGKPTFS